MPFVRFSPDYAQTVLERDIVNQLNVLGSVIDSSGSLTIPAVDLRLAPYSVVAGAVSAVQAAANATAINQAIVDYSGTGKTLLLPTGEVWVDKVGANWSINFSGVSDVALRGQGQYGTTIVQTGAGTGADWYGIRIHNSSRVTVGQLGIRQGTITNPSAGQHDHLIAVLTLTPSGVTDSVLLEDLYLGKCIGDGIAFIGDETPITNVRVNRVWGQLNGVVNGPSGRIGARTGISFQRGYWNIVVENVYLYGAQNSLIDMEATATTGTLRYARFSNVFVDNTFGLTSVAWSYSGSHSPSSVKSYFPSMENCTIYNGRLQIAETEDAVLSNVRVVEIEPPAADTGIALIEVRFGNSRLSLVDCQVHRIGTSAAGHLIDIEGPGPVFISGGVMVQATAGNHIRFDGVSDVAVTGTTFIDTNATAGRAVIEGNAVLTNSDRFTVSNVVVRATGGSMKAAVVTQARTTMSMAQLSFTDIRHTGCDYGVYCSYTSGGAHDRTPIVQNVGLWTSRNESDAPVTTMYPIIAGNRGDVCTFIGTGTPEAAVTAIVGSDYRRLDGGATTTLYVKTSGIGNTGWTAK